MASSNIYNHRSLQPSGAPAPQLARLNESFDAIRAEFDALATDAGLARGQRDEFEAKVLTQVNELNIIRQALYDLEAQHSKVRQQFEDEVARLRGELHAMRQAGASVSGGGGSGGPGAGAPPGIPGLAPGSGAGQGGAGGSVIGGPGNQGPGYSEYFREGRDRERERERDRDVRDRTMDVRERDPRDVRDRERDVRDLRALGLDRERDVRERERDLRDRDRERDRERDRDRDRDREREVRDRDRDRLVDPRDPKRMKNERGGPKPDHFSPNPTPRLPPPPGPGLPPYESSVGAGPGAQGPVGPGQVGSGPVSGSGSSVGGLVGQTSGPSQMGQLSSQLGGGSGQIVPLGSQGQGGGGGFPDDLDVHTVPPELKKEGSDWFALFNPKAKRVLDVNLVHTLTHESVVCCVRFSADGKFLATGCNRTAQIYDTKTGNKTCVLFDESAGKQGDLYIRSVCFSPDGKFLATGAEDKQIRIWDIAKKKIRNIFDGHQQEIYSLDFSHDGRLIVSGSGDKTARIWDMVDGTSKVLTINDPDSLNNDAGVTSVAISPNGQFVAAGSLDTVVRLWDVSTGHLVERLRGHRDSVYSVAFTPDGKGLISGSLDKTLKYWDVAALYSSGPGSVKGRKEGGPVNGPGGTVVRKDGDKSSQCTMNFTGHKDYVLSVAVSHDGQWVVSGSKDRGVQFWDARTATVQCMLQGHKNSVISIDLSPAGSILATGSGDWQARIWNYSPVA